MQTPTKILFVSLGTSLFLGSVVPAAWGCVIYAVCYIATSWNAGKGQFKAWEKSPVARKTWARVQRQEDTLKALATAHKNRLDRINKSALSDVQKRALVSRAEPAVSGQNGHAKFFGVCCRTIRTFPWMSFEQFMEVMGEYSDRCEPPWSYKEVYHKCSDAWTKERG